MKMTKRIFSLALCLGLMLALALPAMAAGETYTLTINNATDGHIYEAYQIFTGSLVTKDGKDILSDIEWGSSITDPAAFLTAINANTKLDNLHGATDAASLAVKLNGVTSDSETIDEFAEVVGQFLGAPVGSSTYAGAHYTISNLAAGYYLVKDQDGSLDTEDYDAYTKYIIRVLKNETVTAKSSVPSVDKTVNDTVDGTFTESEDFDINDTAYYKWEGTLPSNLKSYDTYFYKFIDTLPVGMTHLKFEQIYIEGNESSKVHVFYDVTDESTANDTLPAGITSAVSGNVVTLEIADLLTVYPNILPSHKIVVKYSARITRDALIVDPMTNEVKVEFSNNPNGDGDGDHGTTPPDVAHAFTFKITVDKYDADKPELKLEGAEFVLYKEAIENEKPVKYYAMVVTEEMVAEGKVINGVQVQTKDVGVVYGWDIDRADASILDIDGDGALTVKGLDSGIYYLEETKAPAGYNLMETPVQINIAPTYNKETGLLESVKYEVDSIEQSSSVVGVRNSSGSTLPVTGGAGTTMFYVVGGLLVAAAAVMLISKRRVEE